MEKVTRLNLMRGITRVDAPYLIGIILLLLGMSILDRPGSGVIPLMIQYSFPVNEYALLVATCGVFTIALRKLPIAAILPLVMTPYIFYTYWYYHLQPSAPLNSSITTSFLYCGLMIFMMRSQAIYYKCDARERPNTYLQSFVDQLSRLRAEVLAGLIMIILGAMIHARPVGGVVQFATEGGVNVRLYAWWLIVFGLLRLGRYKSAWDVWLIMPLVFYCIFTFSYIASMPMEIRNPILGTLYASLFIFALRSNLSGRG